jgi:predicted NACHT family NTPase
MSIEFDGERKQSFNRYFEPRLSELRKICSSDELIGEWKIVFHGTQYDDMDFKILNQTASWDERIWEPVC